MYFSFQAALSAVAFVACAAAKAIPQDGGDYPGIPPQFPADPVEFTVCKNKDYDHCTTFNIYTDACHNMPMEWNDVASSVKAQPGFQCFMYSEYNCKGYELGPVNSGSRFKNLKEPALSYNNALSSYLCSHDPTPNTNV